MPSNVTIRPLLATDSYAELTILLNRAYKELADQGWNYTASFQNEDTTRYRCDGGECFVALHEDKLVGTAMLVTRLETYGPDIYRSPGFCVLSQFGVDPDRRGEKIGDQLLKRLETEAVRRGYSNIGLDTAETATALIEYYHRRGFREIGHHQWREKSYRSVVMAKQLTASERT